ncbi:MAG: DUF2937 family protein [Pseudomonadota bacterium]
MSFLARLFGGLLGRILAVVLAVSAAQFPVYYAQYLQTLGGARQEASLRYEELRREAGVLNLGAEDFIIRHEENSDPVFQASGRIHRTTLARFNKLDSAWLALSNATVFEKPLALFRHFDRQLAEAVRFTPGLTLTLEAGAYALGGIVLAWLISALFGAVLLPPRRVAVIR